MSGQDQRIAGSQLHDSQAQLVQAGQDAVSFQGSHENQVIINKALLQLGQSSPPSVDWDWGRRLLEKKQLPEIRKRLTDTLGRERALMGVSYREQLGWVGRSSLEPDRILQIDGQSEAPLDPRQLVIETFGRDDIEGKLLILGTPGAGKTTALLSLSEQLVVGALEQPQTVIPVLFELSTWREDDQSIRDWLVEQLYDQHGGNQRAKLYEQWLDQQVLLPLMDGLDELGHARQKKCTEKLQEFATQYPHLVVCCRTKEFSQVGIRLDTLRGAIRLDPLSDEQIRAFLTSQQPSLWSALETTPQLQKLLTPTPEGDPGLLRIPLFVALAARVYDPQNPFTTQADLLRQYIDRQLSRDVRANDRRRDRDKKDWAYQTLEKEPTCQRTEQTLAWIARQLQGRKRVELLIEHIHPGWLETSRAKRHFQLIFEGPLIWLLAGLLIGVILWPLGGLFFWLTFELLGGLIICLFIFMPFGEKRDLELQSRPNQGIWNSLQSWLLITLLSYPLSIISTLSTRELPIIVASGIANGESISSILSKLWEVLPSFFTPGIFAAMLFGFIVGGGVNCIQHVCLRWVLWRCGLAPWNLARFLNYCVERRLLQRVGGSYRFLHRELLDHFAAMR